MRSSKIAKIQTPSDDRLDDQWQGQDRDTAGAINNVPFLDGRGRLISVRLAAGVGTLIRHGLGVPSTFFMVRPNYSGSGVVANVVESATSFQPTGDRLDTHLSIVASASCIVDLWFYPRASNLLKPGETQAPP